MSQTKERIEYLDALKGIGIILVVFCHNVLLPPDTILGNYLMGLCWLAVPCFMMVSGALYHQKKQFSLKSHFKKLGIMYLCFCSWRIIHVLIWYALNGIKSGIRDVFQFIFLFHESNEFFCKHMWYMMAYFFVMLLFPVTYALFQNKDYNGIKGRKILVFMMCLAGFAKIVLPSIGKISEILGKFVPQLQFDFSGIDIIMPFGLYANMLFYFILGAFLFEYREKISEKIGEKRIWLLPVVLISGVGMIAVKAIETGTFYWADLFIQSGYTRIITVIMSVAAYLFFAEYGAKFKKTMHFLGTRIGQYTMGIFYLHRVLLLLCTRFIYPYIRSYESVWLNLLKTVVITFVCILLTILMRKIPVIRKMVS